MIKGLQPQVFTSSRSISTIPNVFSLRGPARPQIYMLINPNNTLYTKAETTARNQNYSAAVPTAHAHTLKSDVLKRSASRLWNYSTLGGKKGPTCVHQTLRPARKVHKYCGDVHTVPRCASRRHDGRWASRRRRARNYQTIAAPAHLENMTLGGASFTSHAYNTAYQRRTRGHT